MNRIFVNIRRLSALLGTVCLCLLLLWRLSYSTAPPTRADGEQRPANPTAQPSGSSTAATRRQGDTAASDRSHSVVRIVHQSWINASLPPLFSRWSRTFRTCFPTYRHILWTDADNRQLIARHYPWFLPRFDSYGVGVQKADVSRLFYMYHHGGLYCDLDCECLDNFEHLLANVSLAFGAMEGKMIFSRNDLSYVDEGQIENSFMYSRPGHPFFWDLIQLLNATTVGMPIMSSGPYLIMRGINSARKKGLDKTLIDGRPYLTIYPPRLFNPYSWIRHQSPQCRLFGEFTEATLKRCRDSFKDSYVIQYHTQVWDKGRVNVMERIKL